LSNVYGVSEKRPRRRISIIKNETMDDRLWASLRGTTRGLTNYFDVVREGMGAELKVVVSESGEVSGDEGGLWCVCVRWGLQMTSQG
jgi:hypothetical protein